jgi:hypothetical protein
MSLVCSILTASVASPTLGQNNPRDYVGALSDSELLALKGIIDKVGKGLPLTPLQESQAHILTRRLRTFGVQSEGEESLKLLAKLVDVSGNIIDNRVEQLAPGVTLPANAMIVYLELVGKLINAISEGVQTCKNADLTNFSAQVGEGHVTYDSLTRKIDSVRQTTHGRVSGEDWNEAHEVALKVRWLAEHKKQKDQRRLEARMKAAQTKAGSRLIVARFRYLSSTPWYDYRYVSDTVYKHSARPIIARSVKTLTVVDVELYNDSPEAKTLQVDFDLVTLVDANSQTYNPIGTTFINGDWMNSIGPTRLFAPKNTYRPLGGIDFPTDGKGGIAVYRMTIKPFTSVRGAYVFNTPQDVSPATLRIAPAETSGPVPAEIEVTLR